MRFKAKLKDNPLLWLRSQLPKWKHICPSCKKTVTKKTHKCPFCGCRIGLPVRVPAGLKTKQQIRDYVIQNIFPRISKFDRVMLAFHFTDLFSSGVETGDFSEWTGTNGGPSVSSTTFYSGAKSMKFDTHAQYAYKTLAAQTELYCRVYVMLTGLPPSDGDGHYARIIHFLGNAGADSTCRCYFSRERGTNLLSMYVARFYPAATETSYHYDWQPNVWYCFELWFKKHASTGGYKLWLNDALVVDDSGLNTSGSFDIDQVRVGAEWFAAYSGPWPGSEWCDIYVDDVVMMDNGPIGTFDLTTHIDYETGDFSQVDGVTASPAIDDQHRHCGIYSCENSAAAYTEEGPYLNIGYQKEIYFEMPIEFDDLPSSGKYIEFLQIGRSGLSLFKARIYNDSGTIKWSFGHRHAGSFTFANSAVSTNPSADTWYCVKGYIKCSHTDGSAVGTYQMWIDDVELNDITQTNRDTDYVVVNEYRIYLYTDETSGATFWHDCIYIQTTAFGTCHTAGSEDVAVPLEAEEDCVPVGDGWLQVFLNCQQIPVFDIDITESKGGIGTVNVPYEVLVERGDLVHVICESEYLIAGKVTQIDKDRSAGVKKLTLKTKTQRLDGVRIDASAHRAYEGWDAGAIAADLIDYYFDGLFVSDEIDAATGIFLTLIDLYDKSVLSGFEELANRSDAAYRVDENNVVHYFVRGSISTGYTITQKDLLQPIKISEIGEPIGKLKVVGFGVTGQAGNGIPQVVHSDRRITSSAEAQEVAEALLDKYGQRTKITLKLKGFYKGHWGESLILDTPNEGFKNETKIIDQIKWSFKASICETTIEIGASETNLEFAVEAITKQLDEQLVNRVSTHIGTETGDSDPFLNYTDLLDLSAGGEVRVNDGAGTKTLRSGACASESDAATIAYLEADIGIGGSGGGGWTMVWIEDAAGNKLATTHGYLSATYLPMRLTCMIPYDYSGENVYVKALAYVGVGGDVYLTSTLKVRQFIVHSHPVTQPVTHEVD